jgi:protein-S-isoprenylcysteine O-methyltransferase Ste14
MKQGPRMNTDYLLFLSFYLSSLIVRTGYELLKKMKKVNPKSIIDILYWRRLEEKDLESWYGDDYRKYLQGT